MDRGDKLTCAAEAFKEGKFKSIRAAALNWDVPPSTYRLRGGQSCHNAHVDEQACLPGEEEALIQWIRDWAAQSFPIRMDMLKSMVEYLIQQRTGLQQRQTISFKPLSHNWPYRFVARHKYLQSHVVKPIEVPRSLACTHEIFNQWFEVFRTAMEKYKPDFHNIYNIDETGFRLGANERQYVIIDKRQGPPAYTSEAAKGESLTVIECAYADGSVIPLFIIYKGQNIQGTWISDAAPNNWMIATSPKG
jgi:hypothetical protein